MTGLSETPDLTVLESPDRQLIVHRIPDGIGASFEITMPPWKRVATALRLFLTVTCLEAAWVNAAAGGGQIWNEKWKGPGFIVCNVVDPEGTILQVR